MPLESIHNLAFKAAEAARCAGEQGKYWEMHDRLFENQKTLEPWATHAQAIGLDAGRFEQCMSGGKFVREIRRDMEEARKAGVTGTPAFFLGLTEPGSSRVRTLAALKGAKAFAEFKSEIERLLAQPAKAQAEPAEGQPSPAPLRSAPRVATATFDADIAGTLARVLATAPEGSPAWIAAQGSDARAVSRAEDLARIFKAAGWQVRTVTRSPISIKPGTYLFAREENPPPYVDTVRQALEQAGLSPTVANGYREYYAQRTRTERGYRGFPFAPEQTFLLVVGRLSPGTSE